MFIQSETMLRLKLYYMFVDEIVHYLYITFNDMNTISFVSDDYFKFTLEPLVRDLCDHLKKYSKDGWEKWCLKWSSLSIDEFLRTDRLQDSRYPAYRPWPAAAVDAFRVFKVFLNSSTNKFTRDYKIMNRNYIRNLTCTP